MSNQVQNQNDLPFVRTQLLLDVMARKITATQAAKRLGVSRKTWHEWQTRGMDAMILAMTDKPNGRPPTPVDPEKIKLQRTVEDLTQKVEDLECARRVLQAFRPQPQQVPPPAETGTKKKP